MTIFSAYLRISNYFPTRHMSTRTQCKYYLVTTYKTSILTYMSNLWFCVVYTKLLYTITTNSNIQIYLFTYQDTKTQRDELMTNLTVNSRICGFTNEIHGEMDGNNIQISIDTDCEKVKKISSMEVPKMEIFDIKENYVMNNAQKAHCCATCIVPSGVLHVCNIEAGFISSILAKKSGSISIDFE